MKRYPVLLLLMMFFLAYPLPLAAKMELGIRGGKGILAEPEDYAPGELYFLKALPWQNSLCPATKLYARLDVGIGYIHTEERSGGWLAGGMDVVFGPQDGAWEFEGGFRPTWLFEDDLGGEDFGGPVQFTSHVGATYKLSDVVLSYRYQHISNAGIYDSNPGINLQLVGVGVSF